jgi:hypothetical protein
MLFISKALLILANHRVENSFSIKLGEAGSVGVMK